ncbi:MAG: ABC-2 transporter permease [Acidobacteria bacterium]|nr:ABC-2 transporter permease [Acidobacteriota bacterium]
MTAFWALVIKDLRLFFGDRRAVIMSFIAPILIGSFFGYVFGGGPKKEQSKVKVLVVDQDRSATTKELMGSLEKENGIEAATAELAEAREAVRKGRAPVAIVLPKGFGESASRALFMPGAKPEITVMYDPSHTVESSMVRGMLTGQIMQTVSKGAFSGETGKRTVSEALRSLEGSTMDAGEKSTLQGLLKSVEKYNALPPASSGGGGFSIPFAMKDEPLTARAGVLYNAYAHSFGGMAIQFMLFMGIDVGIGMLLLRQRGLWRRFRAAPLSKTVLLGSRACSATLIGMMILSVVFTFARVAFDVRIEGSLLGFVGVCAAFSLMTAAYGMLIAAIGRTPEAARGLAILATLLMVMLSGAWVPSFLFPQWMQPVTKAIPARWAMDGIDAMTWRGSGGEEAVMPILVLLSGALVFGVVAVWRFRWEAE